MEKMLWGRWVQCKDCPFECGSDEAKYLAEDNETIVYRHEYECGAGENCDTDIVCNRYK